MNKVRTALAGVGALAGFIALMIGITTTIRGSSEADIWLGSAIAFGIASKLITTDRTEYLGYISRSKVLVHPSQWDLAGWRKDCLRAPIWWIKSSGPWGASLEVQTMVVLSICFVGAIVSGLARGRFHEIAAGIVFGVSALAIDAWLVREMRRESQKQNQKFQAGGS